MTTECKNCGAALTGRYCSACGQRADVSIPSVGRLVADAVQDLYSFDSRLWRSLVDLTCKPGRMTTRYLEGQRARYTPPFRLYVASSLVFFLLFFSFGRFATTPDEVAASAAPTAAGAAAVVPEIELPAVPQPAEPGGIFITTDENGWKCNLVDDKTDPALRARLEAACEKLEKESGASFARALADHVPVMMLVFIPLVAVLMKVLYLFARRRYVEHLVFFLHVHTFFFFTAILTIVLARAVGLAPWLRWPVFVVSVAAWLYFPVYLYVAMRHVYRQGHALTTAKYLLLGAGYLAALITTLLGLLIVTAATL